MGATTSALISALDEDDKMPEELETSDSELDDSFKVTNLGYSSSRMDDDSPKLDGLTSAQVEGKSSEIESVSDKSTENMLNKYLVVKKHYLQNSNTQDVTNVKTPGPDNKINNLSSLNDIMTSICGQPGLQLVDEEAQKMIREGNPDFIYEKIYAVGTRVEVPSFKCWKCPTAVDRLERLEFHYLSHGASKRYKCKYCDFSVDQMHVVLRHEETHRPIRGSNSIQQQSVKSSPLPVLRIEEKRLHELNRSIKSSQNATKNDYSEAKNEEQVDSVEVQKQSQNINTLSTPEPTSSLLSPNHPKAVHASNIDDDEPMSEDSINSEVSIAVESGEEMEVDELADFDIGIDEDEEVNLTREEIEEFNEVPNIQGIILDSLPSPSVANTPQPIGKVWPPQTKSNGSGKKKGNNISTCPFCPAKFPNLTLLKKHKSCHSNKNAKYACKYCSFACDDLPKVNKHEDVHGLKTQTRDHPPQNEGTVAVKVATKVNLPEPSPALSAEGSQTSSSTNQNNVTESEEEKIRIGNPEFIYETHHRRDGNPSYKCYICPTSFTAYRDFERHALRHGAKGGAFSCRVCDFNASLKITFEKHLERHRAQGNILPHLFEVAENKEMEVKIDSLENAIDSRGEQEKEELQPAASKRNEVKVKQKEKIGSSNLNSIDEYYDIKSLLSSTVENKQNNYLLVSMNVTNFMCFEDICFRLDSDTITFSGGEGKSASIIAILLGLGYDLLIPNYSPSVLCGWEISDLIRRGREVAKIEICLNVNSYPGLAKKYGSEFTIVRTLRRGVSLSTPTFQIEYSYSNSPKLITIHDLRKILTELGIVSSNYKLLLLDKQNLKGLMNDSDSWYSYFEFAVAAHGEQLQKNLQNINPIFQRLDEDLQWRKKKLEFLKLELQKDYPIEKDPCFLEWRKEDLKRLREVEAEIIHLTKKHEELSKLTTSTSDQLTKIPILILEKMKKIYSEFLNTQNCVGDIILDESEKRLGIWLREKTSSDTDIPKSVTEADCLWKRCLVGRRQLSIFGLYLCFWTVIDNSPFFSVDSYSSAELEFKFPSKGLPILMKLAESKRGQQFIITYPEN